MLYLSSYAVGNRNPQAMVCEYCTLCGTRLTGPRRRFCNQPELRDFVSGRCRSTPFVYSNILSVPAEDRRMSVCIPCVNWKRRAETSGFKRQRKPLLQLDSLILYILQPGRVQEPDHRCMDRLLRAARQRENPLRTCFPLPVVSILDRMQGNDYLHVVTAWWEYNGKTVFFQNPQVARRVRCAVKAGYVDED